MHRFLYWKRDDRENAFFTTAQRSAIVSKQIFYNKSELGCFFFVLFFFVWLKNLLDTIYSLENKAQ